MIKKKVFGCFLLFAIEFCEAQPNTFLKIYSNYPPYEVANSVVQQDSGYIAVFLGPNGAFNLLIKTNMFGDIVLTNSFCGDIGCSLIKTVDSNYIYSAHPYGLCSTGGFSDFMVYKINSNLDTLWMKEYGTANEEVGRCVRQLKDGNFALAGYTNGSDNFYKLDSAGNVIWHHWVPMNTVRSVIQDSEGNFVLCGYTDGIPNSWTVVKTDSSGANILWAKYYGTNGGNVYEFFYDLVQLPDSNYLLAGQVPLSLMKINKNTGDSLWNMTNMGIYTFDRTANGNYITAAGPVVNLLNDTGGVIWIKTYTNLASFNWVRSTSDGGFILAGTGACGTNPCPMLLKTDSLGNFTTDIENLNIKTENYSLYPNPLTTQSRLEFGNARHEGFVFTLYDITGRKIEKAATNGDHFIINKDTKQDGLYFFKLENEKTGEVENGKVVAQ